MSTRNPLDRTDVDDKVIAYLDANAKVARIVAWVAVVINVLYGVYALTQGRPIGTVIAAISAVALFWLLVKTKIKAAAA